MAEKQPQESTLEEEDIFEDFADQGERLENLELIQPQLEYGSSFVLLERG